MMRNAFRFSLRDLMQIGYRHIYFRR